MRSLRRLIGIVLMAAVGSLGVQSVLADGPQESPGMTSTQASPGLTTEIVIYIVPTLIP